MRSLGVHADVDPGVLCDQLCQTRQEPAMGEGGRNFDPDDLQGAALLRTRFDLVCGVPQPADARANRARIFRTLSRQGYTASHTLEKLHPEDFLEQPNLMAY